MTDTPPRYWRHDETYFAHVAAKPTDGGATAFFAWTSPNLAVAAVEWTIHEAAVHGNGHSVVTTAAFGALSGLCAVISLAGLKSRRGMASAAGSLSGGASIVFAGIAGLLWNEGIWSTLATIGVGCAAISGLVWHLRHGAARRHEDHLHDAGIRHDEQATQLESKWIAYKAWVEGGGTIDERQAPNPQIAYQRHADALEYARQYVDSDGKPVAPAGNVQDVQWHQYAR